MRRILALILVGFMASNAGAYPVDGYEETGIARLYAFDLAREQLLAMGELKPGSLWPMKQVKLRLLDRPNLSLPASDPGFSGEVKKLLGGDAASYGVAILDLSEPGKPRYAEVNGTQAQQPGSVGKMMVMLAFFQGLADAFPDVAARERVLKNTVVTANELIRKDSHVVPVYKVGDPKVVRRPIAEGDRANLWTYLDWMVSASSNAAASTVLGQVILLKHFGAKYPVSEKVASDYLRNTPKGELSKVFADAVVSPLRRNGLNPGLLQQGSFFTREGRNRVTSAGSTATARELVRYCLLMEQGKLVDRWSSLQIKRLLYLSDIRIRYASNPILDNHAVYFKSGSLYGCRDEPGYQCGKYLGNKMNYMNSVAMVETGGPKSLHYIAAVLSNVLKKNSKDVHVSMAAKVHRMIQAAH